jgi:ribulose-5-phosphate 4-epimerase/fuculose-1-phosphate aldolase
VSACSHTRSPARDLLAGCQILDGERLTDAFGHISARLASGEILLTPRIGPGLVCEEHQLLRLAPDGEVLEGDGTLVPGEATIHLSLLHARPEIACVCRFHGAACLAWSTLGRPLPATTGPALLFGPRVGVFDTASTITTPEQGEALAATLGGGSAILLRGFGAVTAGSSVADAVVRATLLERSAAAVLAASAIADPHTYPVDAAEAFAQRHAVVAEQIRRAWSYLQARWCASAPPISNRRGKEPV